ncbi:MAG: ArsR/SmtB family transcription factor [Actinomycetota bacterium]
MTKGSSTTTGRAATAAADPQREPEAGDRVNISDARAIRALAHNVRLKVIEELFDTQQPATATELAQRHGLTPSAMSYHLRALEKWGFVKRCANQGDGRERHWQAAAGRLDVTSVADSRAATLGVVDVELNDLRERLSKYVKRDKQAPDPDTWRQEGHLAALSTGRFYLTEEQRKDLGRRIGEILLEFSPTTNPENRGEGAEKLYYVFSFLPGDIDSD